MAAATTHRRYSPPTEERPWRTDAAAQAVPPSGQTPQVVIEERVHRGNIAGDVVRRYLRGDMLGKGGFAKVYKVREIPLTGPVPEHFDETQKVYACKIVDKDTVLRRGARQKLQSEVRIHSSLHHTNIVKFERCFEDQNCVYILLELCPNRTLMELLRARRRLTEPEARFYAAQILGALYYMHQQRLVIHRDIKLGNLFLGENLNLKIGDFGLAAQLEDNKERKKTICGTPNYIAPEVLSSGDQGGGHSFEVDIWSVGVVLFTLLVGKPPFETDSVKTTYRKIRTTSYTFPAGVPVSACAKDLIEIILTARPERRPTLTAIRNHPFFSSDKTWIHAMPSYTLDRRPQFDETISEQPKITSPRNTKEASPPQSTSPVGGRAVLQAIQRFEKEMQNDPSLEHKALASALETKLTMHSHSSESHAPEVLPMRSPTTPKVNSAELHQSSPRSSTIDDQSDEADTAVLTTVVEALGAGLKKLIDSESSGSILFQPVVPLSEWTVENGGPWVCKWIEYSSKYGLGYQMCDGRFGVYFNDATKIVSEGDDCQCYIDRRKNQSGQNTDRPSRFSKENRPEDLSKKVVLLGLFSDFLAGYLSKGQEEPLQDPSFPLTESPVYVKRWMRTRHAIIFRLSNRTVQVVFCDSTEVIISSEAMLVTYRTKTGRRSTYPFHSLPPLPGLAKRLRYAKNVISQMITSQ